MEGKDWIRITFRDYSFFRDKIVYETNATLPNRPRIQRQLSGDGSSPKHSIIASSVLIHKPIWNKLAQSLSRQARTSRKIKKHINLKTAGYFIEGPSSY